MSKKLKLKDDKFFPQLFQECCGIFIKTLRDPAEKRPKKNKNSHMYILIKLKNLLLHFFFFMNVHYFY